MLVALVEQMLGQKIAMYRRLSGLKQAQVAKKLGVTPETISRLERGRAMPSLATVEKLASALGVELFELFRLRARQTPKAKAVDQLLATVGNRTAAEIDLLTALSTTLFRRSR